MQLKIHKKHRFTRHSAWLLWSCIPLLFPSLGVAAEPHAWQPAAEAAAHAQLMEALPPTLRDTVTLHWEWRGARGAATAPCAVAWEIGTIKVQQLDRIHVPLQCAALRGSVAGKAVLVAPLWQTAHDLPARHVLAAHDLQSTRAVVQDLDQLIERHLLLGLQLRRDTPERTVLGWSQLVRPIVLRQGDALEIRASHAGVSVHMPAVATRPARLGDETVVRNVRSQQLVRGKLVAPRLLEADAQRSNAGSVKVVMESND